MGRTFAIEVCRDLCGEDGRPSSEVDVVTSTIRIAAEGRTPPDERESVP